jgi:iron complex transport system substrate-binding protein
MVPPTQPSSSALLRPVRHSRLQRVVGGFKWVLTISLTLAVLIGLGGLCSTTIFARDSRAAPPSDPPPPAPPRRIVSLAPSLTETVEALGAADLLVAVTRFCQLQAPKAGLHRFDRLDSPSLEKLAALQPDLVLLTPLTLPAARDQMRSIGLPLLVLEQQTLRGSLEEIRTMGRALHREEAARSLCEKIDQQLETVRRQSAPQPRTRTVVLYDWKALYSTNNSTFAGELLEYAGGENLAGSLPSPWPRLPAEWVLASRPECILLSRPIGTADPAPLALDAWRKDPLWKHLPAVQSGRVFALEDDLLSLPGPRLGLAAKTLFDRLRQTPPPASAPGSR